jgi:hypothetical protein
VPRDNPLLRPLQDLFQRLVSLTGLAHIVEDYLQGYRRFFTDRFEEQGLEADVVFAGFNLIVWDITPEPEQKPGHWRPVSSFSAAGTHYFELADHFVQREAAWTVSQTYEAFETYLKELLCAHLASQPSDSITISLRQPANPSNPASWRSTPKLARWSSACLLASLRALEPSVAVAEANNTRQMQLSEWHTVLGEVRHAATHSDMRIRRSLIAQWPPSRTRLLRRKFPGELYDGDYVLHLTRQDAESTIQMAADYAFLLFKCMSRARGLEWDILAPTEGNPAA